MSSSIHRTKENLWIELCQLNSHYVNRGYNSDLWEKITGNNMLFQNKSAMKICTVCKGYAPLTCNPCYHYVKFVATHAPNPNELLNFLVSLKNFHRNNEECYSWEDYERDI